MNKVILIGNITQDLELKQTPNGIAVLSFSIATNERVKNSDGEYENKGEFHNLVAWKKTAELIEKYQSKGSKIAIVGKLQTRNWEDQDSGKRMYRTEIIVNEIEFLSPSKKDEFRESDQKHGVTPKKETPQEDLSLEDIPF